MQFSQVGKILYLEHLKTLREVGLYQDQQEHGHRRENIAD